MGEISRLAGLRYHDRLMSQEPVMALLVVDLDKHIGNAGEQGVAPFRDTKHLSESDKAMLMGGTLRDVYRW